MSRDLPSLFQALRQHPLVTLEQLVKSWLTVSLVGGLVATAFDLSLVIALVQLAHFNPAAAAPLGVTLGACVNFAINKAFAFKDSHGKTSAQLLRFLAGTALAAAVHAGVVHVLTNVWGVHYVISKLIADILVFTVGNVLLLRFVVFPKSKRARKPRAPTVKEGSTVASSAAAVSPARGAGSPPA